MDALSGEWGIKSDCDKFEAGRAFNDRGSHMAMESITVETCGSVEDGDSLEIFIEQGDAGGRGAERQSAAVTLPESVQAALCGWLHAHVNPSDVETMFAAAQHTPATATYTFEVKLDDHLSLGGLGDLMEKLREYGTAEADIEARRATAEVTIESDSLLDVEHDFLDFAQEIDAIQPIDPDKIRETRRLA